MRMYKFYLNTTDEQPAYFLQVNPQNKEVDLDDFGIIEAAKILLCDRVDEISDEKDTINWGLRYEAT